MSDQAADYRKREESITLLGRAGRHGRDPRAADAQHRSAPPGHARRAAPDRDARGRGRARHPADHRLRPHRDREDGRGEGVLEGDPRRRADGLRLLLLQRDGLLRRGRDDCSRSRCRRAPSTCACIHLELNRIMSHLVWLGTSALDLGAISMFWYCFRERETILDLFEMSSGQRMHTRYFQVGGVIEDIPPGFAPSCASSSTRCRPAPTSTPTCSRRTRSCSSACAGPARWTRRRCWASA